jgi:hypothetical protein
VPLPLLEVRTTRLSVHGAALLEGKFVGRIDLDGRSLNFVNGRTPEEQQLSVTGEWLQAVKDLFPLRVNHFTVNNFDIKYRDPYTTPIVDVRVNHVRIEGNNSSNTRKPSDGKEALIVGVGLVEGVAPLAVRAALAPALNGQFLISTYGLSDYHSLSLMIFSRLTGHLTWREELEIFICGLTLTREL